MPTDDEAKPAAVEGDQPSVPLVYDLTHGVWFRIGGPLPDGTEAYRKYAADEAGTKSAVAEQDGSLTWLHLLREDVLGVFAETDPKTLQARLRTAAARCIAWHNDIETREGRKA